MVDRREFLATLLACAFTPICYQCISANSNSYDYFSACFINTQKHITHDSILKAVDTPNIESAERLFHEFSHICNVFNIRANLLFLGGEHSYNAYADHLDANTRLDGTIYLGKHLLLDEVDAYSTYNVAFWGIMSHECGHILQFSHNMSFSKMGDNVLYRELEADFLAGYYLGQKWRDTQFDTRAFRDSVSHKGDLAGRAAQTHGSREQRVHAVEQGIRFGLGGAKSITQILDVASAEAKNIVALE